MENHEIVLYGIAGEDKSYQIIRYCRIEVGYFRAWHTRLLIKQMREEYPEIKQVFAIDNRPGLAAFCRRAMKEGNIDDKVLFKYMLEREGFEIVF